MRKRYSEFKKKRKKVERHVANEIGGTILIEIQSHLGTREYGHLVVRP